MVWQRCLGSHLPSGSDTFFVARRDRLAPPGAQLRAADGGVTGSSWLNQIERWFAEITRKRIRRGTFRSVRELVKAIQDYLRQYNKNPQRFQWVASASRIIRKVNKYKEISETGD